MGVDHTGTFFCDRTTAQSLPRTPIDMIFAAVMALKAYSAKAPVSTQVVLIYQASTELEFHFGLVCWVSKTRRHEPTNLVQSSLIREDRNVSIIRRGTYRFVLVEVLAHSCCRSSMMPQVWLELAWSDVPDILSDPQGCRSGRAVRLNHQKIGYKIFGCR
jgi:hypothetical protein